MFTVGAGGLGLHHRQPEGAARQPLVVLGYVRVAHSRPLRTASEPGIQLCVVGVNSEDAGSSEVLPPLAAARAQQNCDHHADAG